MTDGAASTNLGQAISDLAKTGADSFDPPRFRVIQALARRALDQRPSVRAILDEKAFVALADYRARFSEAREQAETLVARVVVRFPDSAELARSLFASGDFSGLQRLASRLQRKSELAQDPQQAGPLAMLIRQIDQRSSPAGKKEREASLGDLLLQQEEAVLQRSSDHQAKPGSIPLAASDTHQQAAFGNSFSGDGRIELHSVRQFRELLARLDSEKRVTRVISEGPAAPGPLNPQALVIRTLATLRDLSPDYLRRFVSYADTLLWLEQAGEKSMPHRRNTKGSKRKPT